jgi:hypothetical protein
MTTTPEGEQPRSNRSQYGPYGFEGRQVGECAVALWNEIVSADEAMPFTPGATPQWNDNDRLVFFNLMDFESSIPGLEDVVQGDLDDHFSEVGFFRAALPFTEDEQQWLYGDGRITQELDENDWEEMDEARAREGMVMVAIEAQIIRLGEQHHMAGADVVRRWAAWRREADEYEGQDTLSVARNALRSLVKRVTPDLIAIDDGQPESLAPKRNPPSHRN